MYVLSCLGFKVTLLLLGQPRWTCIVIYQTLLYLRLRFDSHYRRVEYQVKFSFHLVCFLNIYVSIKIIETCQVEWNRGYIQYGCKNGFELGKRYTLYSFRANKLKSLISLGHREHDSRKTSSSSFNLFYYMERVVLNLELHHLATQKMSK